MTCLAFVAIPTAAQAFTMTYEPLSESGRVYSVQGDDTSESLTVGCSGGEVTANGLKFFSAYEGHNLRCGELDYIGVNGNGGNDTISTVAVSKANGFNPGFGCCDDPPTPSHAVELYGGTGRDTLNGGPFGEQFNARHFINEGADTVHAGGGRDRIAGTRDADKIFGDAGDDLIDAQPGNDVVHGGPGKDYWDDPRFSTGRDRYFGDGGNDTFIAGGGPDRLDGGPGSDYMQGGGGRDRLYGRAGVDGLEGQGGGDFLFGGPGPDYLTGGPGFDHLFPGPGRNHLVTQ